MTSSSPKLVSPQRRKIDGHANMGRYEHRNKYHILGMDGDESACSLEEPLFDEDQEISDVEVNDEIECNLKLPGCFNCRCFTCFGA